MMHKTPPKPIRENLSRAKNYLRRNDIIRSLAAVCQAMHEYMNVNLIGQARFEVEVMIQEYLKDINRHPDIISYFASKKVYATPFFRFARGKEREVTDQLETVLHDIKKARRNKAQEELDNHYQKKQELLKKGINFLEQGDTPRGKACLRRVIDGWGDEPGMITDIALIFLGKKLYFEAADLFEKAIEAFPNDAKAVGGAIRSYKALREFERCEELYLYALKTFGMHPKTMLNLAKLYVEWRKMDDAYDYAKRALDADPSLQEAIRIRDEIEKRIFL